MRKIFVFVILGAFILLNTIGASVFGNSVYGQVESNLSGLSTDNPEALDQYQNETQGLPLIIGRYPSEDVNTSALMAQSFVPTKEVLTKVELYICKNFSASEPFVVDIRKDLNGDNLATSSVLPENINSLNVSDSELNLSWVSFNVQEAFLDVGETYYLVAHTENTTDNWYIWAQNNDSNSYLAGEAYISYDEGSTWTNHSKSKPRPHVRSLSDDNNKSDMCFKTYGIDATQISIEFQRFGKNLTTIFNNTGSVNATSIFFEVKVTGGLLGLINETTDGLFIVPLVPNVELEVQTPVFGLGPVDIQVTVYASNVELSTVKFEGFVLFRYIYVPEYIFL